MFAVSASVAVYVPTAVAASATLTAISVPSENTGDASLTSVIVTVTARESVFAPSVTEIVTSQMFALLLAPHEGASKFLAAIVNTPVSDTIAKSP